MKRYSDLLVAFVCLIAVEGLSIAISALIGGREATNIGAVIGYFLGIGMFYTIRGEYDRNWTFLQAVANSILTSILLVIYYLSANTDLQDWDYLLPLLAFAGIPILVSINKYILDVVATKSGAPRRKQA